MLEKPITKLNVHGKLQLEEKWQKPTEILKNWIISAVPATRATDRVHFIEQFIIIKIIKHLAGLIVEVLQVLHLNMSY